MGKVFGILFIYIGFVLVEHVSQGHHHRDAFYHYRQQNSYDFSPECESEEVSHTPHRGHPEETGHLNFWQFKRSSQERSSGGSGWGWGSTNNNGMTRYGDQRNPNTRLRNQDYLSQGTFSKERKLGKDKTSIVIEIPTSLANLLKKKKKDDRRSRPRIHEKYAPAYISYGPIYGKPPPPIHVAKGHQENNRPVTPPPAPSSPMSLSHRTTPPTFQNDIPPQMLARPSPSYGPPTVSSWTQQGQVQVPPQTTPFTFPPPTYGLPPRIQYVQPPRQEQMSSHYSTSNQPPARYQAENIWSPYTTSHQGQTPTLVIQQSQEYGPIQQHQQPERHPPPPQTYLPPTSSTLTQLTSGWRTWNSNPLPTQGTPPPSPRPREIQHQTQNLQWTQQQNQNAPKPMSFGPPPMQNFESPLSSYGQPPPSIGDPPQQNRHEPKKDIYRNPTNDQSSQGQQNQYRSQQNQQHGQYGNNGDYLAGASESEEWYSHSKKPSIEVYQTPTKPYRPPRHKYQRHRSKDHNTHGDKEQSMETDKSHQYISNSASTHLQLEQSDKNDESGGDPNSKPPPKFDTNYNSQGLSQDLKIVDWMPVSAKYYYELPGSEKKKSQGYQTLPESLDNYRSDPEHEKYPQITYDSLHKRSVLLPPASTQPPTSAMMLMGTRTRTIPVKTVIRRSTTLKPRQRSRVHPPSLPRNPELEIKTEEGFNDMLYSHARLPTIR